jgi:oligogalacturonide lyase
MSGCSRRAFLAAAAGAGLGAEIPSVKGETFASDVRKYFDPTTEFPVLRVTSPEYDSSFIPSRNRDFLGRNSLLFSCDRNGPAQVFRVDLKGGEMRQLTSARSLDPNSIALLAGNRSFCFFDGDSLRDANTATLRDKEIYQVPDGFKRTGGVTVSLDRARAYFVERNERQFRLRSLAFARTPQIRTVIAGEEEITDPAPRPGAAELLYRSGNSIYLTKLDGARKTKLPLPAGWIGAIQWMSDGKSILYLHAPAERQGLHVIREFTPETGDDKLVARTTQFIDFAPNADGSVFVGASGSKAAPHILILVRSVRRELTVCEHRASDPTLVRPHFSPDSQRILFASDRHGKPAIYELAVERLVEETEAE